MTHYIPVRRQEANYRFNYTQHNQTGMLQCHEPKPSQVATRDFGHMRPLGDCTMFEQPYFSPNYIQMPTNYMRRPHHWVDRRITLDDLSRWANESVRHERAFGVWHNVFGTRYFYGENRRL